MNHPRTVLFHLAKCRNLFWGEMNHPSNVFLPPRGTRMATSDVDIIIASHESPFLCLVEFGHKSFLKARVCLGTENLRTVGRENCSGMWHGIRKYYLSVIGKMWSLPSLVSQCTAWNWHRNFADTGIWLILFVFISPPLSSSFMQLLCSCSLLCQPLGDSNYYFSFI